MSMNMDLEALTEQFMKSGGKVKQCIEGDRASLPVGVPDGLFLGDALLMWNRRHDNPPIKVGYEYGVADALLQIMGAPTVKAEQVQCDECGGNGAGGDHEDDCSKAPSLPAAGSPDLTRVKCPCCPYEYEADSFGAGFIAGKGMCQVCHACHDDMPAAGSAVEEVEVVGYLSGRCLSLAEYIEDEGDIPDSEKLMTVAQHQRIVSALSALQSAPELVSVPVELLERIAGKGCDPDCCIAYWREQLRALLESHAEGGKV